MPKNVLEYPIGGLFTQSGSPGAFASNKGYSNVKSFGDEAPFGNFLHSIWNDVTGATAQRNLAEDERNWQEYFFNEYQSAPAMVEQYRMAGLNPNMLNGSAGSASPASVSTPSSGSPAAAVGDVASAIQGFKSLAQNEETIKQNAKRLENDIDISQFGKRLTEAQTYAAFMKGGYDSELAMGAAISNYWANDQNIADLAIKRQNRANMEKEWSLIQANTDFVNKQLSRYDEMIDAELDLKAKQALEAEKHAFQLEQSAQQTKLENDFFEKWNYHSDSPLDVGLRNRWQQGDFSAYDNMLDFALDYGYKMSFKQSQGSAEGSFVFKLHEPQSVWELPDAIWQRIRNGIMNAATKPEYQNLNDIDTLRNVRNEILEGVPQQYQEKFNSAISDYDIQQILNEYTTSGTK